MKTCGVRGGARSKIRYVMFDFDMVSEIITFEEKADEITLANDEDGFFRETTKRNGGNLKWKH